jgi:hypothetical protein
LHSQSGTETQTFYVELDPDICPVPPEGAPFDLSSGFTMQGDTRTMTQSTNLASSVRWSSVDAQSPPDPGKGEDNQH